MKKRNKLYVTPDSRQLWFFIIAMLTLGLQASSAEAQHMKIGSGIYFVNNVRIKTGSIVNQGILTNGSAGAIKLTGNWQNNGSYTANTGSLVTFNGTDAQEIGGTNPTTFSNVTLNNSSGCSLASGVNVEGTLDFQSGKLTTGTDTLKMGASGTITNANASKYVNGKLAHTFSATGSKMFPVGKEGVYRPVTLQFTSLTGTSIVTVEQHETALAGTLPVNTYLLTATRYWSVGQNGGSNMQYFMTLDATGSSASQPVVFLKKDGSNLVSFPTTAPNYTNTTALTSFGDFTLGEKCPVHTISGYAKYENNPLTPLNGLKIVLEQNSVGIDSVITTSTGFYQFNNVNNGNYGLTIKSAHPSGQWQTWGGVNNTDYLLVSKHIAGTQLLPVNSPVIRTSASVKLQHPAINNTDATAIRQAVKFPLTGYSYFDTTRWVFSGIDASNALDNIVVGCADITRDIRGLCAGDVNGTYVPATGYKTAVETLHATSLQLEHHGNLQLTDEMTFPIRVDRDMEIGAITLYLDFDPSVMIVTNVTLPGNPGAETWFNVKGLKLNVEDPTLNLKPETLNLKPSTLNTLAIGWMSPEPVKVAEGQAVILIHARLLGPVQTHGRASLPSSIRFTLNENPLSEFADGDGNVIDGLKLSMPTAGNGEMAKWRNSEIFVYPNPAHETLNLELETFNPEPETLNLELVNLQGVAVISHPTAAISAGQHKYLLDLREISPGVYFLRARMDGEMVNKKIVITR